LRVAIVGGESRRMHLPGLAHVGFETQGVALGVQGSLCRSRGQGQGIIVFVIRVLGTV